MTSLRAKRMGSARPDEGGLLSGGVSVRRHTMRRPATLYLRLVVGGLAALSIYFLNGTFAQEPTQPSGAIEAAQDAAADGAMAERIRAIFAEIDGLGAVGVDVSGGVVTLSGEAANERLAEQALAIASRIQGAVTVVDEIKRTMAVEENLSPVVDDFTTALDTAARAWPLYLV
ncbi:MAG: BON domain-containing protein, partial [Pseudomonadota bacterium]